MKKVKLIESKTGNATIEKHECKGIKNYMYLGDGIELLLEKASVYCHDAFYHWYLYQGGKKHGYGTLLKDIKRCPFCGKKLSKETPVPDFDEPDEY